MREKLLFPVVLSVLPLFLAACVPTLAVVPARGSSAEASVAGVTLAALPLPWQGEPHDLNALVLPVAVEVRNGGPVAVEINLADFVAGDGSGPWVHACLLDRVPPEEPPPPPPLRGPFFATQDPPLAPAEGGIPLRGTTAPRPISDAQRLALAEGTLLPGQRARGFLYFKLADLRQPRPISVHWQPHQAGAKTMLGEVELHLALAQQARP